MKRKFSLLFALIIMAVLFSACGSSDIDMDGIPNKLDECPQQQEDFDKYKDNDGCPDPDNDADGVPDTRDKCLFEPEDRDNFEDEDGCPELDNDGDGMPDDKDDCPMEPEDNDGFKDNDGCPDLDNDGDGILDVDDKCKIDPEDIDGFEDEDGCPEFDNDKDGIKDTVDKCPLQPENKNGKDDSDGCPDRDNEPLPEKFKKTILFVNGTAELTFETKQMLENEIVPTLKEYTEHQLRYRLSMPRVEMDLPAYLQLLNNRYAALANFFFSKGIQENQIGYTIVTEELYNKYVDHKMDFNQNARAMFKRMDVKK